LVFAPRCGSKLVQDVTPLRSSAAPYGYRHRSNLRKSPRAQHLLGGAVGRQLGAMAINVRSRALAASRFRAM